MRHGLFNPNDEVVSSPASIVPEVVAEADVGHLPRFEKRDHFFRPARIRYWKANPRAVSFDIGMVPGPLACTDLAADA